jgi:tetratricopeptide (TPR) repeat protein
MMDEITHQQVTALSKQGAKLHEAENYAGALKKYQRAWELLPEPKTDLEAATWILTAIGDANFFTGNFQAGKDNLLKAMLCPDAIGNPFIHLRLGQCQYELGNLDKAADQLIRAYMGAGKEIFEVEEPKYFEFLKTRAKAPAEGW